MVLDGYKTYIVGVLACVVAILGYIWKFIDINTCHELLTIGLIALGLRNAIPIKK